MRERRLPRPQKRPEFEAEQSPLRARRPPRAQRLLRRTDLFGALPKVQRELRLREEDLQTTRSREPSSRAGKNAPSKERPAEEGTHLSLVKDPLLGETALSVHLPRARKRRLSQTLQVRGF